MTYRQSSPGQIAPVGYSAAQLAKHCAYNQTRKRFLSANVEVADFSPIIFEDRLPLLTESQDFAMWHLPFRGISPTSISEPFDLVFLDPECKVIEIVESFPISEISASSRPATSCLALKAGTIETSSTQPGDQLLLCGSEEMKRLLKQSARNLSHESVTKLSQLSDLFSEVDLARGTRTSKPFIVDPNAVPKPAAPAPAAQTNPAAAFQAANQPKNWLERLLVPPDPRKNGREAIEGLVAYFFTGGNPVPHSVRDVGLGGIYILTEERWSPDTIIRLTLTDVRDPSAERSITLNARVVRWGNDGVGFKFVLNNPKKNKRNRHSVEDFAEAVPREAIVEFLSRIRTSSAS